MALENIIKEEYLNDYVNASEELSNYLAGDLDKKRTVIIPSRGAYIFHDLASEDILFSIFGKDLYSSLEVLKKIYKNNRTVVFPYTYDNSYLKDLSSRDIRNYWVKITKEEICRTDTENLEINFYNYLLNNLIYTKKIKDIELMFDKNTSYYKNLYPEDYKENTLFIDTAISGRTISELISSFKAENFYPELFLIVNGNEKNNKLKGRYKKNINEYITNYGGKIVYVNKLFTEDNTPALLGATSILFPQFTENLNKKTGLIFGAATWKKPFPIKINYSVNNNKFFDLTNVTPDEVYTSYFILKKMLGSYYITKNNFDFKEYVEFNKDYTNLEKLLFDKKLLDKEKIIDVYKKLLYSFKMKPEDITINSSFVINMFFNEKKVDELVDEFISNNELEKKI